ncbi:GNAT family N-acetyltransferase [Hujiaoplasma nucleasis]|uniref:GNAT family N-acetyltransferase n=1 Tax=Hujiaoplasma nucleasis TaxID=2725268 RepID=A0A7L6N5G1_9MOLU|nr:GNAT family protein [Hujiaoplasma nucleasis]QLY40732.1 GNAT family N-acetyltransferase [Hujiaoplasma nucleasis]
MDKHLLFTETKRLTIRNFTMDDILDYYEYLSDPEVLRFEPYKAQTMDQMENIILEDINSNNKLAVELKSSKKMIGNIYFGDIDSETKVLGYVFNKKYWNQGYAKEATKSIIDLSFKYSIQRIEARCDPLNIPSWKLLESLGFTRLSHLKKNTYFWKDKDGNPIWKDTYIYSLNKDEHIK